MATKPTEDPKFAVTGGLNVRPPNNDLVQNGVPAGGTWGRQNLNWMFMAISKWIDWIRSFAMDKSLNLSDLTDKPSARINLGLGNAATRNIGESSGNVMQVGAFGLGGLGIVPPSDASGLGQISQSQLFDSTQTNHTGYPIGHASVLLSASRSTANGWALQADKDTLAFTGILGGNVGSWHRVIHTGNILTTTGQSPQYPMTQKAVTDALNANSSIGVGQTWQNVTGSRVKGTTYTNTTGKPIQILVQYQDDNVSGSCATFKIGGLSRTTADLLGGDRYPFWFSAIIPDGEKYSISGGVLLPAWWELR